MCLVYLAEESALASMESAALMSLYEGTRQLDAGQRVATDPHPSTRKRYRSEREAGGQETEGGDRLKDATAF